MRFLLPPAPVRSPRPSALAVGLAAGLAASVALVAGCADPSTAPTASPGPLPPHDVSAALPNASVDAYLARHLPGPTCGKNSVSLIGRHFYADPETWHSAWKEYWHDVNEVGGGEIITIKYYENAVNYYDEYDVCSNHKTDYAQDPTVYLHRYLTKTYVCNADGAGCRPWSVDSITGWYNGTTFPS